MCRKLTRLQFIVASLPLSKAGTHHNFLISDHWRRKQENVYMRIIKAFVGASRPGVKVFNVLVISKSGS